MKFRNLILAILAFVLAACGSNDLINTRSTTVTETAAEIVDFELPAGYSPEFSTSVMGYTLVSYTTGDNHSHLYLIQSEKGSDGEKLDSLLSQIAPGSYDSETDMAIIETRSVNIYGQEVNLILSEGRDNENESYRQVIASFQGKGGPALLVFSEPAAKWNQETVDALIASIR